MDCIHQIIKLPFFVKLSGIRATEEFIPASTFMRNHLLHCPQRKMVYKYMLEGVRGKKEMTFYESVNSKSAPEPLRLLRPFLPAYHGVVRSTDGESTYLALSDLLASFKQPNVCDIKLGTASYRADASAEKKAYEDSKYRWQRNVGFIFSGAQIYDSMTGQYTRLPKILLRSFTPQQIQTVVLTTFLGEDPHRSRQLACLYAEKLSSLWHWFTTCGSQCVTFCRSSVLLAHDTDRTTVENRNAVVVALIDFTDWNPVPATETPRTQTVDADLAEGFARGLTSLAQMFKRIAGDITA
ncbi:Kinase [Fasciola hepatica]|uniref:Kinase n=1 Tax=Fasciola hepatica TaxID=6192 RepID=A0A4E0RYG8_FASHE|nr:Kinase [Fasciola hepatica]